MEKRPRLDAIHAIIYISLLFIAIVLAWRFLWNPGSEVIDLKNRISELETDNNQIRLEINSLQQACERLRKGDSYAIEKVARDDLGYCLNGEIVYQMEVVDPGDPRRTNPPVIRLIPQKPLKQQTPPAYKQNKKK